LIDEIAHKGNYSENRIAVGMDARNRQTDLESLPELINDLEKDDVSTDLLFLQASDETLLKRYSETRRRHPLSEPGEELMAAIGRERELLSPVINAADLIIDTSDTSVYELAAVISERVERRKAHDLSVQIQSFGFKHGIPPDADFVFDLRCLPNPYWQPELRPRTGLDQEVAEFLDGQPKFEQMYEDILAFMNRWIPEYRNLDRSYLTVAIGCTGGQHRSVYMVEKLTAALKDFHDPVLSRHCELRAHTGFSC
jgi:UPF0042 nucleotide-binding protein